jgi:outer membrane lipoprotein-sorting protein
VIAVGAVLAGTMLASAAAPDLPRQTPAQLLAAMRHAKLPTAMTATLSQSANLGFPAIPDIGGLSSSPLSLASLVSGTHTIEIWYAGPGQIRIALPVSFGETDLRVNGSQVWLWDSSGQTATHFLFPAASHYMVPGGGAKYSSTGTKPRGAPELTPTLMTPMQIVRHLLALVRPTTRVTVPGTTVVAGRDAYQLAIAPRSAQSLVSRIMIAVDARTHLPLSVAVYARGSSSPAFRIGFTSLSFARPARSNFVFTPPPGAHVKTVRAPGYAPGAMPNRNGLTGGPLAGVRTFGSGWLTVADIPAGPAAKFASGNAGAFGRASNVVRLRPRGSGKAAFHSSLTITSGAARQLGMLGLLLRTAKPVHGSWGSGRLLGTRLISVLITKGQLLVGAVTPAVLYADAAKIS